MAFILNNQLLLIFIKVVSNSHTMNILFIMKGMSELFEFLTDNSIESIRNTKDKMRADKNNKSTDVIRDIDELIFPDDEPYYISER